MDYFQSLEHTWTRDLRSPLFTFELYNEKDGERGSTEWGFYCMSLMAWHILLAFMFLHAFLSAGVGAVVYEFVVKPGRQGTALSYLVAYSLLPVIFFIPFQLFSFFNISNQIMRFCIGTIMPVTCLFKTTAAAHGFTPDYAKASLKSFCLFYATPMLMTRNRKLDKFEPITLQETMGHLKGFFKVLFLCGFLQTLFHFLPDIVPPMGMGNPLPGQQDWYNPSTLLSPKRLFRNMLLGFYLAFKIQCFSAGLTVAQGLATQYKTGQTMDSPLTTSRNMSQMWGQKWNLVVHDALKLGVYLPVRKYLPKTVAMLATFLASGAFHEILLLMFTMPFDDSNGCLSDPVAQATKVDCYTPPFLTTTWFFVWHAILVGLEYSPLGQLSFWSKAPTPVCIFYVLMAGAMFGDCFIEPYWNSLCFENSSMMFFVLKPVAASAAAATS